MLRRFLSYPWMYNLFSTLIGADLGRGDYVNNYVKPQVGQRFLDIGCGPGNLIPHLPNLELHGFDISAEYIAYVKRKYGNRGTFVVSDVSSAFTQRYQSFDIVNAVGVIHHLDDQQALDLFKLAHSALKPNGRLVTVDGCYRLGQSVIAKTLLDLDRGEHIREQKQYVELAKQVFTNVEVSLREDMLRLPYSHIIMDCTR